MPRVFQYFILAIIKKNPPQRLLPIIWSPQDWNHYNQRHVVQLLWTSTWELQSPWCVLQCFLTLMWHISLYEAPKALVEIPNKPFTRICNTPGSCMLETLTCLDCCIFSPHQICVGGYQLNSHTVPINILIWAHSLSTQFSKLRHSAALNRRGPAEQESFHVVRLSKWGFFVRITRGMYQKAGSLSSISTNF